MTPDEQRTAIEVQVTDLFSGNSIQLRKLMMSLQTLLHMEGIASFHTQMPWKLELPNNHVVSGLSYNLATAVQDIYGQLQALNDNFLPDTEIKLTVDATRFQDGVASRASTQRRLGA